MNLSYSMGLFHLCWKACRSYQDNFIFLADNWQSQHINEIKIQHPRVDWIFCSRAQKACSMFFIIVFNKPNNTHLPSFCQRRSRFGSGVDSSSCLTMKKSRNGWGRTARPFQEHWVAAHLRLSHGPHASPTLVSLRILSATDAWRRHSGKQHGLRSQAAWVQILTPPLIICHFEQGNWLIVPDSPSAKLG